MSALINIERCNQDAANVATVSGVNGLGVVGYLANQLPGPTINRGYHNLRHVSNQLQVEQNVPQDLKAEYYDRYFELFAVGQRLKDQKTGKSCWEAWKLYRRASNFETRTHDLRDKVQTSSDFYAAINGRGYTPSVHSVDSDQYIFASRPSTPTLPEATIPREPSSCAQPESGVAATLADASDTLSAQCLAGRLLATVEEELPEEDITTQEHIPLEGVAVPIAVLETPDDVQTCHPLSEHAGRPSP